MRLLGFILFFLLCLQVPARAQAPVSVPDWRQFPASAYLPDEIQVRLTPAALRRLPGAEIPLSGNSGTGIPALDSLWKSLGFVSFQKIISIPVKPSKNGIDPAATPVLRWLRIKLASPKLLGIALDRLTAQTRWVELAEPVYRVEWHGKEGSPVFEGDWLPNDSLFSWQWNFNNYGQTGGTPDADIDLPEAWGIERGHPSVIVGVVDNGIDTNHTDLRESLSALRGYNFYNNQPGLVPGNHGNHTAGTIAARNHNTAWVSGIAGGDGTPESGVRLVSCQVFGVPSGAGGLENAFFWSAQNGVAISSNSWGYTQPGAYNQSVLDAIDYFIENGGGGVLKNGLVVFSGGNGNDYARRWPGAYPKVIGVSATTHNDLRAWYSTYHEAIDIAAPGGETNHSGGGPVIDGGRQGILSTILQAAGAVGYQQGSSMAAPHVAGVAALVASHGRGRLSADDVKSILLTQADEIDGRQDAQFRGRMGTGRLNAHKALQLAAALVLQPEVKAPLQLVAKENCGEIVLSWTKFNPADRVLVAVSTSHERGGLFGIPAGSLAIGDSLPGGGKIIYTGTAGGFNFSDAQEGLSYYFKIWTVGSADRYSMGIVPPDPVTPGSSLEGFNATVQCYNHTDLGWQFGNGCPEQAVLVACNTTDNFGNPSGNYLPGDSIGTARVIFAGTGKSYRHLLQKAADSSALYYRIWPLKSNGSYGEPLGATVYTPAAIKRVFAAQTGTRSVLANWEKQECFTGDVLLAFNNNGYFNQPEGLLKPGDVFGGGNDTVLYYGPANSFLHEALQSNRQYFYGVWPVVNGAYGYPRFFSAKTRCTGEVISLPYRDTISPSSLSGCSLDTIGYRNFTAGPFPQLSVKEAGTDPSVSPFSGRYMLAFNSFDTRETNEVFLTTPPLSTRGVQSVDVAFKWYEDGSDYNSDFFSKEGITLQWSTDNLHWDTVISYPRIPGFGTDGWKYKQVTLPAAASNRDMVYVRWVFRSAWGFNCYLDEIAVLPTSPFLADGSFSKAVAQFSLPSGITYYYNQAEQLLLGIASAAGSPGHVEENLDLGVGGQTGVTRLNVSGNNYVQNKGGWGVAGRYWHINQWEQPGNAVTLRYFVPDAEWQLLRQLAAGFNPAPGTGDSIPMVAYWLKGAGRASANPASGHAGLAAAKAWNGEGFWQFDPGSITDTLRYRQGPFITGWKFADLTITQPGGGGIGAGSTAGNGGLDAWWVQLSGNRSLKTTVLNWTTGYEREWLLMEVERMPQTGGAAKVLGYVSPGGWSQSGSSYGFTDAEFLPNGIYQYRIRATDAQGKQYLSPAIAVTVDDTKGLLIYPNPAAGGRFTIFSEQPMEWLRLADGLGRVVYTVKPMGTRQDIHLPFLPTGVYFLQASMASGVMVQKLWLTP